MDEEPPPKDVEEEDGAEDAKEGGKLLTAKSQVLFQARLLAHYSPRTLKR
jgi:hypothetical protein